MHPALTTFDTEAKKILEFLHAQFSKLQTGRANPVMIESAMVEAYGQMQPLKTVAGITIEDARTMLVQPWDRSILSNVEKALTVLDLGTAPTNDGSHIRIVLPPMTEERRKSLVKTVHTLAEEARISVRNHRHDAKSIIDKEADEDVKFTALEELKKKVDETNGTIDASMKKKEEEVMKI